jgi:type II secretory pathway component PulK
MERVLKKVRWPSTLLGFPVEDAPRRPGDPTPDPRVRGKRGVALIIAIMIISVMMLITSDLILTSQVNIALAAAHRDNLKAEYMARSAANLATMLLSADFAYDLFQAQQMPKDAQLADGQGDFWGALNGLPIGGETLEMMSTFQEQFELSSVMDSGVLDQLKLFDGTFILDVTDEQQKINVNYCAQGRCSETLLMLEALFSCPAEKAFLETKKVTGKELALRIKDWVDTDSRAEEESGFNDEDEPYTRREPKVRAKNGPFDSVDELRMIEGWDEDVHAVFSRYVTVFPFQKKGTDKAQININTASRALLQCLFPEARGDCEEKSAVALRTRNEDKTTLGGGGKKMADILRENLCYSGGDGNPGEANNRANWFAQSSTVFRVETSGTVGDAEKKLTAIIERTMPDPKKNEKSTYKILYWRVF